MITVAFIIVLTGCVSKPDNYDKSVFTKLASLTVTNLAKTKPKDFQSNNPMISIKELCKHYTIDPANHRDEMLDIGASSTRIAALNILWLMELKRHRLSNLSPYQNIKRMIGISKSS